MNNAIFYFFYNLSHQSVAFDGMVIFFGVLFPYIVIVLAGLFLLFHHDIFKVENPYQVLFKKKKEILLSFFTAVVAYVLAYAVKFAFSFSRPFDLFQNVHTLFPETGYSFPSGHATFFTALAVSLFFYHKKVGYIFMFFALLIGIARIIAGVHFPVDILGGFALGALVAFLVKKYS